jgi:hypothetical protein
MNERPIRFHFQPKQISGEYTAKAQYSWTFTPAGLPSRKIYHQKFLPIFLILDNGDVRHILSTIHSDHARKQDRELDITCCDWASAVIGTLQWFA